MENLTSVKVKHRIFDDAVHLTIPPGSSIQEIIDLANIPDMALPNIVVLNHGSVISDWEYVTKDADNLAICVVPQGGGGGRGKSILGAVAMIAVAAFAWYVAPVFFGAALGSGITGIGMSMVAAGLTMVGSMAINALIKPPSIDLGALSGGIGGGVRGGGVGQTSRPTSIADAVEASTYSFGGQSNIARKYQPSVKVYGRHRLFPAIAVNPLIENAGAESTITTIYDFGLGTLTLEDMRIGDADLSSYNPQLDIQYGTLMRSTKYYPRRVAYDSLSYVTKKDQPIVVRTKPDTQSGHIDMYFPRGLVYYDDRGNRVQNKVQIEVWWRMVGNPEWIKVRDDQFVGGTVRQDVAITDRVEVYEPGKEPQQFSELYSRYASKTYWLITHYPRPDWAWDTNPSAYDSEVTIMFDGEMIYGGPESSIGGVYGEYSQGRMIEDEDYLPRAAEYYFAVNRNFNYFTKGTFWKDYQVRTLNGVTYGTEIVVNDVTIHNGAQIISGVYGDYQKGNYKESNSPTPTKREDLYSIFMPVYTGLTTSTVVGATSKPFTLVAAVDFGMPGTYEFQIVRKSSTSTDNRNANDITVTLVKSFQAGEIFNLTKKHTMMEMRLLANDKINGVVSNVSAICTSVLRVWDGAGWIETPTRNPAWVVYDILTGESNPAPLKDEQMDLASFYRLAQFCDEQITTTVGGVSTTGSRYVSDFVVDYETTVFQLIESVLSACRATLIITQSGKYGVLIDKEQTVPRQLFTPNNSWGFSGNRTYADRPNALRVKYVEPQLGWQMNEVIVYDDGFNSTNATKFEDISTFGITDGGRAWRYGRYMIAQGLQRSEQFMISVDVENLAVQRGDLVRVAHDVPKIGGLGARVVEVVGNNVKVSESVFVNITNYTVRLSDGTIRSGKVIADVEEDIYTFDDVSGIEPDDLIVFGNTERVTQEYLVQEIIPGADLTADLTLVRYVAGVYTADEGDIPPWDSGLTDSIVNTTDLKVIDLVGTSTLIYPYRVPIARVELNFDVKGRAYSRCNIYLIRPGYKDTFLGEVNDFIFREEIHTILEPEKLGERRYHVVPINSKGIVGTGAYVTVNVEPDRQRPEKPYGFSVNVQSEIVEMFWQLSTEVDLDYYVIRYTPEVISPRWNASQFLSKVSWQTNHASAGARTGTYMIKAVDTSGNESIEAMKRTTVAQLPNINYIEKIEDHLLDWPGLDYLTASKGSALYATGPEGNVQPTAYYVCDEIVDLGEVYEVRISNKIRAYGQHSDDLIYKWNPLSEVQAMAKATSDQWDAWVEVRVSDAQFFISQWVTMESVDPIAVGDSSTWSEWRPVEVGDFTGKYFQFRIQLRSYDVNVRPVVTDGTIDVDMPDRVDYGPDVEVPVEGLTIFFNPAFRVTPTVVASIDGNDRPVVTMITNKDRDSFDVQLRDVTSGEPVAGRIDWQAEGYGKKGVASI